MDWIIAVSMLVIVSVVAGLAYLGYKLIKKHQTSTADLKHKAQKPLACAKGFVRGQEFRLISPASLAKDGKFADLDFIVVGYFGVLGVKCIGLGGEIYGSAGDAMWLQVAGTQRTSFENPLLRAQSDARLVRDTLFAASLKSVPVEVVCVCTNPRAVLALPRSTGHFTNKEFAAYLKKNKFEQDEGVDIAATAAAIEKWRMEPSA